MEKNKILNQIEVNRLAELDYEFIIAQLCVLNNKPFEDMKQALDELIVEGAFKLKSAVVVEESAPAFPYAKNSKKHNDLVAEAEEMLYRKDKKRESKNKSFKLQGKLQGTKSGFAFLIPFDKTYEDVFIAGIGTGIFVGLSANYILSHLFKMPQFKHKYKNAYSFE